MESDTAKPLFRPLSRRLHLFLRRDFLPLFLRSRSELE